MTQFDVDEHNRRTVPGGLINRKSGAVPLKKETANAAPDESEIGSGGLHDKINAECIRRRWYVVHSRTDKKSTNAKGTTDFIIAAPPMYSQGVPITFWIEAKAKGRKLTKEQNITRHVLLSLDHKWKCVYSLQEFIDFVDGNPSQIP